MTTEEAKAEVLKMYARQAQEKRDAKTGEAYHLRKAKDWAEWLASGNVQKEQAESAIEYHLRKAEEYKD